MNAPTFAPTIPNSDQNFFGMSSSLRPIIGSVSTPVVSMNSQQNTALAFGSSFSEPISTTEPVQYALTNVPLTNCSVVRPLSTDELNSFSTTLSQPSLVVLASAASQQQLTSSPGFSQRPASGLTSNPCLPSISTFVTPKSKS